MKLKSKLTIIISLLLCFQILFSVFVLQIESQGDVSDAPIVQFRTSMGNITIHLREDRPITVGNFKNLVQQGVYDNTIFHRVISNFMIQGGDPNGNGMSDDGIPTIPDELTPNNQNNRGTIAMANAGPNTGTSQFFINVVNNNYLDALHPVFGEIIEGMDVVDAISNVNTDTNDRPQEVITIIDAQIIQEGYIPIITNVSQNPLPNNVNYTDQVRIETTIEDTIGLYTVILSYRVNSSSWNNLTMTNSGGNTFFVDIEQFSEDTSITYKIIAENKIRNFSFSDEYQYQVIPEFPSWIFLPLFLTATIVTLVLRKRLYRIAK